MRNAALSLLFLFACASALAQGRDVTTTVPPREQCCPSVASDGLDFMTAFGDAGVAAARVSRAGFPLDDGGLGVAPVEVSGDSSIAFSGSTYLIAWIGSAVYTRRYASDGAPIDPAPVLIQTVTNATGYYHTRRIAVAGNGKAFLVVWIDSGRPDAQFPTLFGATIAVDGRVSAARPIIGVGYYDGELDVAWNGQVFVVIWGYFTASVIEGPPNRAATLAVRVARDGAPIDEVRHSSTLLRLILEAPRSPQTAAIFSWRLTDIEVLLWYR